MDRLLEFRVRLHSWRVRRAIASCGRGIRTIPPTSLSDAQNITIGDNFSSMGGALLYANDGELEVGDNCALNTNVQLGAAHGTIRLGHNVIIGPNVVLRAADHGITPGSPPRAQPHQRGSISIGDDVWIGANAVITRNVELGAGCVIGAGAVVAHDIPPNAIAVGTPAKVIGFR